MYVIEVFQFTSQTYDLITDVFDTFEDITADISRVCRSQAVRFQTMMHMEMLNPNKGSGDVFGMSAIPRFHAITRAFADMAIHTPEIACWSFNKKTEFYRYKGADDDLATIVFYGPPPNREWLSRRTERRAAFKEGKLRLSEPSREDAHLPVKNAFDDAYKAYCRYRGRIHEFGDFLEAYKPFMDDHLVTLIANARQAGAPDWYTFATICTFDEFLRLPKSEIAYNELWQAMIDVYYLRYSHQAGRKPSGIELWKVHQVVDGRMRAQLGL